MAQGVTDPFAANVQANLSLYQVTENLGGNAQSAGYYSIFYNDWNASFLTLSSATPVAQRETASIQQALRNLPSQSCN